jgi:hypothetical protein
MKPPLPIWSIPLLLALVGIAVFIGRFSVGVVALVTAETVLVCGYLLWRGRRPAAARPPSNLLPLLPGHLLLLVAVALLPDPDRLAWLWALLPVVTVTYDLVGSHKARGRASTSILIGLYAILWAAVFTLLNRVIAISRGFGEREEILAAVAFAVFGGGFVVLGVFRHGRTDKE